MPYCSIFYWFGRRTRGCGTASWSRTRPPSTTIRRALEGSTLCRCTGGPVVSLHCSSLIRVRWLHCDDPATARRRVGPTNRGALCHLRRLAHGTGAACSGDDRFFGCAEARVAERPLSGLRMG